jgi:putative transposase
MPYTRLRYHIVTATKHRDMIITPELEAVIHPALQAKALDLGAKLLRIGGVEDHIHIVAAMPASIALADFVRELKTASSRAVNKVGLLEARFEWQRGYGAFTLNPSDLSTVLRYVANQKQHHAEGTLWYAYEKVEE